MALDALAAKHLKHKLISARTEYRRYQRTFDRACENLEEAILKHRDPGTLDRLVYAKNNSLTKMQAHVKFMDTLDGQAKKSWT